MPILDIQRQYNESYRIRLGTRDGNQPRSLTNEIRITSPSRDVVAAFAETYGGRPRRWTDQKAFQVFLPVTQLPVVLLPGQNITQWMELWTSSVCARRCDGQNMQSGAVCECGPTKPVDERECRPTTRLTVVCPDVPVVGTGRLVTHSLIAAGEMKGQLGLVQDVLDSGRSVRGILSVSTLTGANKKYTVPRLQIVGLTFAELAELASAPDNELAPSEALALTEGDQ